MLKRKWMLAVTVMLLVGLMGASAAYAAGTQTEERVKQRETNEAWEKLTDAQKAEMYAAKEAADAANNALIDKAVAYGLIDADVAENIKKATGENTARLKEEDQPPLFGGGLRIKGEWADTEGFRFEFDDEGITADFETLREKMKEQLQKAVEEGKLTQEQADQMLERTPGAPGTPGGIFQPDGTRPDRRNPGDRTPKVNDEGNGSL